VCSHALTLGFVRPVVRSVISLLPCRRPVYLKNDERVRLTDRLASLCPGSHAPPKAAHQTEVMCAVLCRLHITANRPCRIRSLSLGNPRNGIMRIITVLGRSYPPLVGSGFLAVEGGRSRLVGETQNDIQLALWERRVVTGPPAELEALDERRPRELAEDQDGRGRPVPQADR
jgi:hypothetical protein